MSTWEKDIIINVKSQATDWEKILAAFITRNDKYPKYIKNSSKGKNGQRKMNTQFAKKKNLKH